MCLADPPPNGGGGGSSKFDEGGGAFSDGGFIFKWGCTPWGQGIGFDLGGGEEFKKNHRIGGVSPHYGKP